MISNFVWYLSRMINGTFNLMGSLIIGDSGLTVLAVLMVAVFVGFTMYLIGEDR